jgi:hypothetical protein
MSFRGRSPINDVVRSVVMSAAMVSPALLASCASSPAVTTAPTSPNGPNDQAAVASTGATVASATAAPEPSAPPTDVVRPRDIDGGPRMPLRGFSGAARARG